MPKFSRNTSIEIVEALHFSTHDQIDRFVFKFQLDDLPLPSSVNQKITAFMRYLADNPEKKGPLGSNLIIEIIEDLIQRAGGSSQSGYYYDDRESLEEKYPKLAHSLKRDGFIIENGHLKALLPEEVQLSENESELESLLDHFTLAVAKGHYKQAVSAHTRGDWAAANAQMRSFIESLFDTIAEALRDEKTSLPVKSHSRREWLARLSPPFLLPNLNEWEIGNRGGFIQGFWNRLHPEGSHPGLSDEEDSTFRLHMVILVGSHYLRRLRDRIG
jgi:hypothetical protein